MDYNKMYQKKVKELNEIRTKAMDNGYILKGNELVKQEYIYVVEVYHYGETTYESSGNYWLEHHTLELTKDEWKEISDYKTKEEIFDKVLLGDIIGEKLEDTYWCDTLEWGGFTSKDIKDFNLNICYKEDYEHTLQNGEDFLLEILYSSKNDINTGGFISIYKVSSETFKKIKEKDFQVNFKKYFTWN